MKGNRGHMGGSRGSHRAGRNRGWWSSMFRAAMARMLQRWRIDSSWRGGGRHEGGRGFAAHDGGWGVRYCPVARGRGTAADGGAVFVAQDHIGDDDRSEE